MIINIKAIECSLAFAPYILESLNAYLGTGSTYPRVVKQAASGLILRSEDEVVIHYRNREVSLNQEEVRHFLATVKFRREVFDINRTSDEVVFANLGETLLLSHPQSEIWLEGSMIPYLIAAFDGADVEVKKVLPEWLSVSGGNGRLLLSDGRNGRWVLLGQDHIVELERRLSLLEGAGENVVVERPPTVQVKGLKIHLQSAFKLQKTFEEFSQNEDFLPYEEYAPAYSLRVMRTTEGMKITDGNILVAVLAKEARKWAAIVESELEKLEAIEIERVDIRTVLAKSPTGCWILQGGDEILLSQALRQALIKQTIPESSAKRWVAKTDKEFNLVLDKRTGACVALTTAEMKILEDY